MAIIIVVTIDETATAMVVIISLSSVPFLYLKDILGVKGAGELLRVAFTLPVIKDIYCPGRHPTGGPKLIASISPMAR